MPVPLVYNCLRALLQSGDYYDLIIVCEREEFQLHRAIVCPQSPEISKACPPDSGNDRVEIKVTSPCTVQVKPKGLPFGVGLRDITTIDLVGVETTIFRLVISFLYTGNYFDGEHPVIDQTPSVSALLTEEAVSESLKNPPGVTYGRSRSSPAASCVSLDLDNDGGTNQESPGIVVGHQYPPLDPEDEDLLRQDVLHEFQDVYSTPPPQPSGTSAGGTLDTSYPHSMFTNFRLYMLASGLGIRPLKLLARERFFLSCVRHIEHEDFPAVIDELYKTTSPDDIIIRDIPCRLIAPRIKLFDDSFMDRIEPIMHKHGVLATGVMNYVIYSSYSRVIGISAVDSTTSP